MSGSARREGLATSEGVDEGSADAVREGGEPTGRAGTGEDLLGEPPRGAPVDGAQAAEPDDLESAESRAARAASGPGQQLEEGEG